MAPSTLDLLVLTFNCAKSFINTSVFAHHLHTVLTTNATGLPDVVVFSLQEVAPLSQSFIGDYFLNPYFVRFDEALNLAAGKAQNAYGPEQTGESFQIRTKPYTLVRAHNVGYTAILLFARDPSRIRELQDAEVGFGAAEMGNKGAVGLRALYDIDKGQQKTEVTFVATHLAAMEWNLPRRNANWATIMRGLTFGNPETVLDQFRGHEGTSSPPTPASETVPDDDADSEHLQLLQDEHEEQHKLVQQQLHEISVFKPTSHLFVAGDLNYRISTAAPTPSAAFPSLDPESEHYYPTFLPLDQLTRERKAGRTFHGMSEAEVRFPPTYKYNAQPKVDATTSDDDETTVPSKFASHRWPSWTDRVLYLDIPNWLKSNGKKKDAPKMDVQAYDALPLMRTSDHRAVFLRVQVPLITPEEMLPPNDAESASANERSSEPLDPRVRLPVEIDPEAWERRRAARRKELLTGWSAFLWSTKEGAWILATLLVGSMSVYWLYTTR